METGKLDRLDSTTGVARAAKPRWLIVGLLFALTLGLTFAARLAAETPGGRATGANGALHRKAIQDLLSFEGRLDRGAVHVGSDGLVHLELIATGIPQSARVATRRPTDLVVVLDRSGSMGGDPMNKALAAIRELIGQLDERDRFSLVTYSNGAELAIPLGVADERSRASWLSRLNGVGAGGGTNMSAGLDRAHALVSESRQAGRVARVVLLSDGHANQGDATPQGLSERSGRAVSGEYVLSTVGVGEGFDERLMTRLADAGTGNFYYVPDIEVLSGIFEAEFESARETVALALEIQIDTPEAVEVVDAAGYPLEVGPERVVIRPGSLYAGQQRSFWVTLRVPASRAGATALGDVRLVYRDLEGERYAARLDRFPAIRSVLEEREFVAQLDEQAVRTHHAEEQVNRLRQSVSALVARGDYDGARAELDSVEYRELEALGIRAEDTESFVAVEALKDVVDRAASAPAARQSGVRNQLGKQLYQAGTDGRRKGAKR